MPLYLCTLWALAHSAALGELTDPNFLYHLHLAPEINYPARWAIGFRVISPWLRRTVSWCGKASVDPAIETLGNCTWTYQSLQFFDQHQTLVSLLDIHASLLVEMRKHCADSSQTLDLIQTRLLTTENIIATLKESTESLVCYPSRHHPFWD